MTELSNGNGVDLRDGPEIRFVGVSGERQKVRIRAKHVRVAKALHAALQPMFCFVDEEHPGVVRCSMDWDHAPLHHRLDMLELAHFALLAAEPDELQTKPGPGSAAFKKHTAINRVS